MKNKLTLMAFISAGMILFSCADKIEAPGHIEKGNLSAISLSETSLEFGCNQTEAVEISVRTTGAWQVEGLNESIREWLEVSVESGSDTTLVQVRCKEENLHMDMRLAVLTFKSSDAYASLIVKQKSDPERRISLSEARVDLGGKEGEEGVISVITSKAWTLEGYDESVQSWLEVTPVSGDAECSVTLRSKAKNEGDSPREALIGFRIDRVNCVWLTVSQNIFIETRELYWTVSEIKAPEGASYTGFPYYKDQSFTATGVFYDGKNGGQTAVGSITETRTYLLQNAQAQEWFPMEFGVIRTPDLDKKVFTFYCNHNSSEIRVRNAYLKIPAIEGFKISHVKVTSINASPINAVSISSDPEGNAPIEDINRLAFGKTSPLDVELTETEAGTPYYISWNGDRFVDSFKFTYTQVK